MEVLDLLAPTFQQKLRKCVSSVVSDEWHSKLRMSVVFNSPLPIRVKLVLLGTNIKLSVKQSNLSAKKYMLKSQNAD